MLVVTNYIFKILILITADRSVFIEGDKKKKNDCV